MNFWQSNFRSLHADQVPKIGAAIRPYKVESLTMRVLLVAHRGWV